MENERDRERGNINDVTRNDVIRTALITALILSLSLVGATIAASIVCA